MVLATAQIREYTDAWKHAKKEARTRNGTAQKNLRSCWRWQRVGFKKEEKGNSGSSVGLNAAIVRAEMGHSATAESKKQINPSG